MNMKLALFIFICFIISFISSCSSATNGTVDWWCARTPYNQTCNHYVVKDNPSSGPLSINQFLDMTVLASIDEARMVLKQTQEIESKYPNVPGKSLWRSCVEYFDGIVYTLNMILNHTRNPTPLDVQTWISGGLTYISMCKEGFELISMTNTGLPTLSTNLTELLLNSLNISAVIRGGNNTHGIADWNFIHEYNLSDLAEDKPDVVVAQDGSGDFTKIQEAINSRWDKRQEGKRFVIYIKAGVYEEYVMIEKEVWDITIFGDGINQTIITGDKHLGGDVINTINAGDLKTTSTFQVWGYGFIARDITFRNTAGAELEQAVAFLSNSDKSAFYHCSFEGYQDTLYTFSNTQFYKECQIYGTVDFIFGSSLAVFQDCEIFFRIPRAHGGGLVATAQGREHDNDANGYSFQGCKIMAGEDLKPVIDQYPKAYLGRPWRSHAVTVFMQSFLDNLVDPEGWLGFNGNNKTGYYGEYKNYGPGSSTDHRVTWPGYHVIKNKKTAKRFTIENYINGNDWLPKTGVPFTPGLYNL
ncbi:pectinesterase, catalytic [Artemisia annua]|uniref:Pectinesterase n=1 Tax=Artemisia annua TaxID=35608 RepID=A0A2U1KMV2_ARTAN|nr:pectinesterase, catalytic [Artemisia annua]